MIVVPTVTQPARRHVPPNTAPLASSDSNRRLCLFWAIVSKSIVTVVAGLGANNAATGYTGHRSMSIPVGSVPPMTEDIKSPMDKELRLPVGMMIVGRVGDAWEQAFDWKTIIYEE